MILLSYGTAIAIFVLGLYTLLFRRNLFKIVIALSLMEGGVLLLITSLGYIPGGVPALLPLLGESAVNPLPQSFTLTAIVIGASDIALALAYIIKIYHHYGTVDVDKIRGLRG